jgi:hypothetical protein
MLFVDDIGPRRHRVWSWSQQSLRNYHHNKKYPILTAQNTPKSEEPCLSFYHLKSYLNMADRSRSTDGPSPGSPEGFDESLLPDFHREFISEADLQVFANALSAPEPSPSTDDLLSASQNSLTSPSGVGVDSARSKLGGGGSQSSLFITAQNDWAPVHPTSRIGGKGKRRGDKRSGRRTPRRSRDETREGYLYTLLKWPLLGIVSAWVVGLGLGYLLTRLYISLYGMFPSVGTETAVVRS